MAGTAAVSRGGRFWRFLAKVLIFLIALWAVAYLVLWGVAVSRERSVEKRWEAAGMPLKGFLEGLPRTEKNAAAQKLEALTAKLGFSVTPADEPQPALGEEWKTVNGPLSEYVNAALESSSEELPPIPEPVGTYLSAHAEDLAAVRTLLLSEKVAWATHPELGAAAPIPNLLGQLNLARLLVAHALTRGAEARGEAVQDLDALWSLGDGMRGSPFLIGQLIGIAETNMVVVTLRHLEEVPAAWRERLAAYDPGRDMRIPLRGEGYLMLYGVRKWGISPWSTSSDHPPLTERLLSSASKPYLRFCAADTAGLFLSEIQRLDAAGPCAADADLLAISKDSASRIPKWNLIAQVAYPNLGSSTWARVKQVKLQLELTEKVLQLKERKARDGVWPQAAPGLEKSFCAKESWRYEVKPEGGFSLSFSGKPISKDLLKRQYPLSYTAGAGVAEPPKK